MEKKPKNIDKFNQSKMSWCKNSNIYFGQEKQYCTATSPDQ